MEKQVGVFSSLLKAFYSFKDYPCFTKLKSFKVFLYILILSLISFLFAAVPLYVSFVFNFGSFEKVIEEYIPDFEIADGILYTSATYHLEKEDFAFLLDANTIYDEGILYGCDTGIAIDCEKIILVSENDNKPLIVYFSQFSEVSEMFNEPVDKSSLNLLIPYLKAFIIFLCVCIYIFIFLSTLFMSSVTALGAMLINSIIKTDYLFGDLFKISVYARTLPLVLFETIALFASFNTFWLFYMLVVILIIITLNEVKKQKAETILNHQTSIAQDEYYKNAFGNTENQETSERQDYNAGNSNNDNDNKL